MTRFQKWFALSTIAVLFCLGAVGQLQQSGGPGSTVSISNFPATQAVSATQLPAALDGNGYLKSHEQGTANVSVQNGSLAVTGAFWQATQPVSGTVSVNALPAGSNVIGVVNTIPKTACGNTVASQALAAVPTSATAVFSSTTCVASIVLNNTNGSSATVTVSDNQGTAVNDVLTFSIPANSQLIQPLGGVAFTSGLKWTASGTGVTGAVLGYQ
jgi:hypothetical protein